MDYISPEESALKVKRWAKNTIAAGRRHSVGLKSDGTVTAVGDNNYGQCNVSDWCDIVAVAASNVHMATNTGNAHTIGLKSCGTVVAVGWNKHDQCGVNDWCDIVAVAADWCRTIGLKSDGSVMAVGKNNDGECNVSGWHDIVAVAAGDWHTIGVNSVEQLVQWVIIGIVNVM
jgi:alpha-tubulin suppressor-like RCC1 family protein